jgi:glycosyltransferase involved in cell wall biosynthesis
MHKIPFGLESVAREIRSIQESSHSAKPLLTVFIGLYNAASFIDDLLLSIRNQPWNPLVNLLIIDNFSTDGSLETLEEAMPSIDSKVIIARNSLNLGALGSFYRNSDLIDTEWVTFMHQDDLYLPNFLSACLRESKHALKLDVSTVSFDYKTIHADSSTPIHYPNPTWFAKGSPSYVAFQESLANHAVPWPCSVFRVSYLLNSPVPFHSAAFLDTEIALTQALSGKNLYVSEIVMDYRVHRDSGSHSLPTAEAEVLRCSSILRIFNSTVFHQIARSVPFEKQVEWSRALVQSAVEFVTSVPLKNLLAISILESLVFAFGYRNQKVNKLLADELLRIDAVGASNVMANMSGSDGRKLVFRHDRTSASRAAAVSSDHQSSSLLRRIVPKLPKFLIMFLFRMVPKKFLPKPWSTFKSTSNVSEQ